MSDTLGSAFAFEKSTVMDITDALEFPPCAKFSKYSSETSLSEEVSSVSEDVSSSFASEDEVSETFRSFSFSDTVSLVEAVGDNSVITLNELTDSIGIEKKSKINYLYEKTLNLGLNYIILLRSIGRHLRILLEAKSNNRENAKDIRPLLHFSRHIKINQQLQCISVKHLKNYLIQLHELEVACKKNYAIHELLIKKFIFSTANY